MPYSNKKTFSEDEVGRLLQRAIERQEADRDHVDIDQGLSLDEIQRIAEEVGIDAKYVQMAFLDMQAKKPEEAGLGIWGSPTTVELERVVPGHLTDNAIESMLAAIRSNHKTSRGQFEKLNHSFEWSASNASGSRLVVSAQRKGKNTKITIRDRMDGFLALFHLWTIFPLFISFIVTLGKGNPNGLLFGLPIAGILFFIARWTSTMYYKKTKLKHQKLLDQLAMLAGEQAQSSDWTYEEPQSTRNVAMRDRPRLDLDDSEAFQSKASSPRNNTRTKS